MAPNPRIHRGFWGHHDPVWCRGRSADAPRKVGFMKSGRTLESGPLAS
jgi:hypothetical protein